MSWRDAEERLWKERKKLRALSVRAGTKRVAGKDTGEPAIIVFVPKKKPEPELLASGIEPAPKEIDGIPVDVVELDPKGDFVIGETSVSEKHPEIQRKIANGVRESG